ncbi:MAG: hypothetical protein IT369_17460, partial [Candidatus Latescibacteria bacterium]|nr:hypothetical protein [Candidatus Latescibacterota bacterium]
MRPLLCAFALAVLAALALPALAQWTPLQQIPVHPYDTPATQRFGVDQIQPQVHRWYAPRHLLEGQLQPWYHGDTGYARQPYLRYVDRVLEGQEWYDTFGSPLGRGWLVYRWEQEQVRRNGSVLSKGTQDPERTNAYRAYFQNLVIASDQRGGGAFRLMIGDRIFTRFTPLTFAKPNFDGLRLDWATDYYQGSVLFSRPSAPAGGEHSHATHLMGGHLEVPLGGQGRLGLTYVNAHNAQTQVALTRGNLLHGVLTTPQQQAPQTLWVRLRDDSPEDNRSGATLYRHEIVLVDSLGVAHWGGAVGLLPRVEGGATNGGALTATGAETILLEYDLSRLRSYGLDPGEVSRVGVELQVANDYHVEMASTLQQAGQTQNPEAVFFTVARAPGNVDDATNARVLFLDYGLPTANAILGIDGEWTPLPGLSLRGELALNRHYARYPGPQPARNFERITQAEAGYLVLSWDLFPWSLFAETFSIDDAYTTSHWLVQGNGEVRFRAPIPDQYEFVDDDDDYNNIPEWERPFQPSSRQVAWPGYDENGDFLFDHNQNDNLVPDYEEPFLRFRSDRPEFLFGLDMNHNHTIDRFENDLLPDYPYRRDHRGYNAYLSARLGPEARLLAGHQRLGLMAGSGRTRAWYLLGTLIRDQPGLGRLQLADFAALVRDDIPDDMQQWVQPVGSLGRMREAPDELAFQHTLSNVLYADVEQMPVSGLRLFHRCKWEWLRQRDRAAALAQRQGR